MNISSLTKVGREFLTLLPLRDILLKKIGLANSELHLENLLAFRWIFYMISLSNISVYGIIKGVKSFNIKIKLTKVIIIILSILGIIMGKTAGAIPHSVNVVKNYYVPRIALPIFILFLIILIIVDYNSSL